MNVVIICLFHDGIRACARNENEDFSEKFIVKLHQGCVLSSLPVFLQRFNEDPDTLADHVHFE